MEHISNLPNKGTLLGQNFFYQAGMEIRIKDEDRMRHIYALGNSGMGKSTVLLNVAIQDIESGKGVAVLDPYGDLIEQIRQFIPPMRGYDEILLDPQNEQEPFTLNLLEANTPEEKALVVHDTIDLLLTYFGKEKFGCVLQDCIKNGLHTLLEDPNETSIFDLLPLFTDEIFQKEKLQHVTNPVVISWWKRIYANLSDQEMHELIVFIHLLLTKFEDQNIKKIVSGRSSIDLSDIMDTGKILLVNLNKGSLGDFISKFLGYTVLTKIKIAMLKREKMEQKERKDFFLFVDEFQNFVSESFEMILTEGRRYRVGLFLANQYLGQLETESIDLKGAIFGNIGTVICYQVGAEDAEFLENFFAPEFTKDDLVNLGIYKAVMKLCIDNQPSIPFSMCGIAPK